ncbi:MAG: type II toxin-antitoxin system Phd/YefM family antitoxin [Balneolaceae bacterium]
MKVYTYSQARQKLSKLLDEARLDGEVGIKKRDGQTFILKSVKEKGSPLDIKGVDTTLTLDELNTIIRESRERG